MRDTRAENRRPAAEGWRRLRSNGGFTMVELLLVLLIMLIVVAATYGVFGTLARSYTKENVIADVQQNLRINMEYMLRDIRLAGLDPLKSAAAGIVSVSPTALRFTADKNMDGDVTDPGEDVTYEAVGGNLQMTDDQGTVTLNEQIVDFSFLYLDADGAETLNAGNVRTVGISLSARAPAGNAAPVRRTYTTMVRCRNIGL